MSNVMFLIQIKEIVFFIYIFTKWHLKLNFSVHLGSNKGSVRTFFSLDRNIFTTIKIDFDIFLICKFQILTENNFRYGNNLFNFEDYKWNKKILF